MKSYFYFLKEVTYWLVSLRKIKTRINFLFLIKKIANLIRFP